MIYLHTNKKNPCKFYIQVNLCKWSNYFHKVCIEIKMIEEICRTNLHMHCMFYQGINNYLVSIICIHLLCKFYTVDYNFYINFHLYINHLNYMKRICYHQLNSSWASSLYMKYHLSKFYNLNLDYIKGMLKRKIKKTLPLCSLHIYLRNLLGKDI